LVPIGGKKIGDFFYGYSAVFYINFCGKCGNLYLCEKLCKKLRNNKKKIPNLFPPFSYQNILRNFRKKIMNSHSAKAGPSLFFHPKNTKIPIIDKIPPKKIKIPVYPKNTNTRIFWAIFVFFRDKNHWVFFVLFVGIFVIVLGGGCILI
jgi:hypothetical protein